MSDGRGPQVGRRPAPVPTLACSSYYPREGIEFRAVVSDVSRRQPAALCSAAHLTEVLHILLLPTVTSVCIIPET